MIEVGKYICELSIWNDLSKEDQSTSDICRSFLEVLKAPEAPDLSRKRRVDCNPPVGKKRVEGKVLR